MDHIALTNCQTWQKRSSNLSKIIIWQINNCNFWNLMVIYQTPMTSTFDEFHAWVKAYHNQPAVAQPSLLLSKSKPINGFAIEQIKKNNTILPFLIVLNSIIFANNNLGFGGSRYKTKISKHKTSNWSSMKTF